MYFHRVMLGLGVGGVGLMMIAGALAQSDKKEDPVEKPVPIEERINRPRPAKPMNPAAPAKPMKPVKPDKPAPINELTQEFPTNEMMQTAWKIHWSQKSGNGLFLQGAWFKKSPKDDWMQVVGDV